MQRRINLCQCLTSLLNKEVKAQNLFSGVGVFCEGRMIGVCVKGNFYLRAKGYLAEQVKAIGAVKWDREIADSKLKLRDYYQIPHDYFLDSAKRLTALSLIQDSLDQIDHDKLEIALLNAKQIRRLPNLSLKSERLLAKVDICTIEQLRNIGAAGAYVLIKQKGLFVTSLMFWKIYAALKNKYLETLTEAEKDAAFEEVNAKLAEAGLRAMRYRP